MRSVPRSSTTATTYPTILGVEIRAARFPRPELRRHHYDEYGTCGHTGDPLAYRPPEDVVQTMPIDPRPVRGPDVLCPPSSLGQLRVNRSAAGTLVSAIGTRPK
jgi:hypothetical protein